MIEAEKALVRTSHVRVHTTQQILQAKVQWLSLWSRDVHCTQHHPRLSRNNLFLVTYLKILCACSGVSPSRAFFNLKINSISSNFCLRNGSDGKQKPLLSTGRQGTWALVTREPEQENQQPWVAESAGLVHTGCAFHCLNVPGT